MNPLNDETSTKYVDKNILFEVPSHLNISNVNSNVSSKRDLSADYIQKIVKMYNEEVQMCSEKEKNNLFSINSESCKINKSRDASSNEYIYNMSPFNGVMESEGTNIIYRHNTNEYNRNTTPLNTRDYYNKKNSSLSNTYRTKQEPEFRQCEYNSSQIRGITDESHFTIKNDSVNGEIESNVEMSPAAAAASNNNEMACTGHDVKESTHCNDVLTKRNDSENEKLPQEHIIFNNYEVSNGVDGMNSVANSLGALSYTNKSVSDKYTHQPVNNNLNASLFCFNDRTQNKGFSNEYQLNYSAESCLLSSHKVNCENDLVQSNQSDTHMSQASSPIRINEPSRTSEQQRNKFYETVSENYSHSCSEHPCSLRCTSIARNQTLDNTTDKKSVTLSNSIKDENGLENTIQKKNCIDSVAYSLNKDSTIVKAGAQFISSESCKNQKTFMEKRELQSYSLDDINKGKVEIPKIIFTPLPMNSKQDNVIEEYNNNKKLQQFMNHCNESVNLIMKYPRAEKKQTNTIRMPPSFTSTMIDHIGMPIVYEDDFDRKKQHPHIVNLHMGNVFEKHVFNMLKNKKELGRNLFKEKQVFEKYNYENNKGFWISNIDKERLINPELNDSYVTELVYEKTHSYDQEMEILNTCENYHATVPPIQELYKQNNFCKFLCNNKMYVPNLKPSIATIMRRYDVAGISDYKISHMSFGIDPVYNNETNYN